jgi:anti-anti-sigma factor
VVLPDRDDASTGSLCPLPAQVELIVAGDRGRHVLHVAGEIDLATVAALRHAIEQLLRSANGSAVIDLSGVTFMDCQGIAALFEAARRAHAVGIDLSAVASLACERLIGLTGLRAELDFYDCVADAP